MTNAMWQLCPFKTPFTSACYYPTDQKFTQLSGSVSMVRAGSYQAATRQLPCSCHGFTPRKKSGWSAQLRPISRE
jgi:hypothetical protein